MRNGKRILSVKVIRKINENPDTSYYGEYSQTKTSDYSIDRLHTIGCPVNTGEMDKPVWFSTSLSMTLEQAESASHSGQCDADVADLAKLPEIAAQLDKLDSALLVNELKEYGAWSAEQLADHEQNLHRIVWLAAGDISENHGCDCGENGDMLRNEYRYFNPSENYANESAEDTRKYIRQDYARMQAYNNSDWHYLGIFAQAIVSIPSGASAVQSKIRSGALWGIESDQPDSEYTDVEQEQLADLKDELLKLGFSRRAIAIAFKSVQEVNE